MKILLSGSSGLIGGELQSFLKTCGHEIFRLVRCKQEISSDAIFWDPEQGLIDRDSLNGFDAVIHLAGENIADGRWNERKKRRILESRVKGTELLTKALCEIPQPPAAFISGSAIGYYGNRGEEICTEKTPSGTGFLAEVCRQWEAAAAPAAKKGIRTLYLRTGVVLSEHGGALGKMLLPFKLGLGGKIGHGQQYISWIAMDDLLAILLFALVNEDLQGPINAVSPNPIRNEEFTEVLGEVLNRPTWFTVPEPFLKLVLGKEMAEEFLLTSTRVLPEHLEEAGYSFLYPDLERTLRYLLKTKS
jgi:uncharacterized protein